MRRWARDDAECSLGGPKGECWNSSRDPGAPTRGTRHGLPPGTSSPVRGGGRMGAGGVEQDPAQEGASAPRRMRRAEIRGFPEAGAAAGFGVTEMLQMRFKEKVKG